jgi:hypothetical protein
MNLPINYENAEWYERKEAREQYVKLQNGNCMFCQGSLSEDPPDRITERNINWKLFPKNFLKYPIHLQHNHDTGATEGAVHAYCNAVLWQYYGR